MLLSVNGDSSINRVEGVLLEVAGIHKFTLLIDNVVVQGCSLFSDNLHHLPYFASPSDEGIGFLHFTSWNYTFICAPGIKRIDGRILSCITSFP